MKISAASIRQLFNLEPPLISGLSEEQKTGRLEGSKVDLTLNAVYTLNLGKKLGSFLGVNLRRTPPTEEIKPNPLPYSPVTAETGLGWTLFSGFYLLQTVETLNMPFWLIGNIKERTTLFRNGTICRVTDADPGFSGQITCALYVPQGAQITIEQYARFLSVRFEPICNVEMFKESPLVFGISTDPNETDPYEGIWSGNKRSTEGELERSY